MEIHSVGDRLGVEVYVPRLQSLPPQTFAEIRALTHRHKLVVFRGQNLTMDEYVQFARNVGTPQVYPQDNYHHPKYPEIFVSSNVPEDGKKIGVAGTGRYWHTDCQFLPEPLPLTMVYPQVLPAVRATFYIDMARVLKRLPPRLMRYIEGRQAIHEGKYRYKVQACDIDRSLIELLEEKAAIAPPVRHPTIIEHPVTGERFLYISSGFTTGLDGLAYEESTAVLRELFEFIERPEHVHTHDWEEGDILLWDNRAVLHKASESKGGPSKSYRIGVYDGLPFYKGIATDSKFGVRDGRPFYQEEAVAVS